MEFRKLTEEETDKVFSFLELGSRENDIFTAIDTKVGTFVIGVYMEEDVITDENGVQGKFIIKCITQIIINKDGTLEHILESDDIIGRIW